MKSLVGFYVICKFTIMLFSSTGKMVPQEVEAECLVTDVEIYVVKTGAPPYIWVDCSDSLSWLDMSENHRHSLKRTMPFVEEPESGACYE